MPIQSINPEQPYQQQEIQLSFDFMKHIYTALDLLILHKQHYPQILFTGSEIVDHIAIIPADCKIKNFLFCRSIQYLAEKGEESLADGMFDMGDKLGIETFMNPLLCYYILIGYYSCNNPIIKERAITNFVTHNHFILNEIIELVDRWGPPELSEKLREYQY